MWLDRTDVRKAIGKLATKLGHAMQVHRRNSLHVLRYLKGVPRMMTVKGHVFNEELLKLALPGAVHVQTDADWGGDPDRKTTRGVIVWVTAATGKWCMVQSLSRKQTTVALSLSLYGGGRAHRHVGGSLRDATHQPDVALDACRRHH
jgi:hypothetical protein